MKKLSFLLVVFALLAAPAFADEALPTEFPKPDVYTIHSNPAFNIVVGDRTEVVTCKAQLHLRTGEPYVDEDGIRRVDLEIIDWQADGYSELMGGDLHFQMEQDMPMREASFVKSYQLFNSDAPVDFPAHAQFAMPYTLETPFGEIKGLYGLTSGTITSFPPRDSIFTMKKGDTAEIVAALLPESVSSMSAAGEITPVNVSVRPAFCAEPEANLPGADVAPAPATSGGDAR